MVIKKTEEEKQHYEYRAPGKDAIKDKTEHKGQGNRVAVQNTTANLSPLSLINCCQPIILLQGPLITHCKDN